MVPSPDPMRLSVPKAFIVCRGHVRPSREVALALFRVLARTACPATSGFGCIEFAELPKTISGKIRRVELRTLEAGRRKDGERGAMEFWEGDFPELSQRGGRRG